MLIESKIRRSGGTPIPMGDQVYHFAPDDEGRHVCDVTNKAHIQRFLSITEGFCLVGAEDEATSTAPPPSSGDPLSGAESVEMVDGDEDEGEEEEEEADSIDDLDLDELAERYEAAGKKMDRRRSLRVLRADLRRIESGL